MQITYSVLATGARQALGRDFRRLNATTNGLLSELGTQRAPTYPGGLSLRELARAEHAAVTDGISAASEKISTYQAADSALARLHGKLASMRDIVDDAALNDHKPKTLRKLDKEFQALAEEVREILAETTDDGTPLLSGYDAVVAMNLDHVTGLSMTDLPEGASATMTLALADVTGARGKLVSMTTSVGNTIDDLQDHMADLSSFEYRVTSAEAAMEVMRSLVDQLLTRISESLSAQANCSPWAVSSLVP